MNKNQRLQMIRRIKLDLSDIKPNKFEDGIMENPCEDGYIAYGTKEKDGKIVPNCIPDPEEMKKVVKEGFPIPSPSGDEDENKFISRCNSELYEEFPDDSQRNAICYKSWRGE